MRYCRYNEWLFYGRKSMLASKAKEIYQEKIEKPIDVDVSRIMQKIYWLIECEAKNERTHVKFPFITLNVGTNSRITEKCSLELRQKGYFVSLHEDTIYIIDWGSPTIKKDLKSIKEGVKSVFLFIKAFFKNWTKAE